MSFATIAIPGSVKAKSYVVSEDFEGSGIPAGWSTEGGVSGASADYDYAASPLNGSHSLHLVSTGTQMVRAVVSVGTQSALWGYFRLRMVSLPAATRRIFGLRDVGGVTVFTLNVTSGGLLNVVAGGTGGSTVNAVAAGSDYSVWWRWVKGTGSNAFGSVGFGPTLFEQTSGNGYHQRLAGTATTDAVAALFGNVANGLNEFIVDRLRISSVATIGNYPR